MRGPSGLAPASSISTLCTSIDPSAALFRPIDRELPIHSRRLLLCVQQGDLNGVRKLLANGRVPANLRVRNPSDGWTALMLAALHGHKEMFRFLLERGHDDHHLSQDYERCNVLIIAAQHQRTEIFIMYANRFPQCMSMKDESGKTPLMYAAQYGCEEIVEFLLNQGQNPDEVDKDGSTALHYASAYGHIKIVRLLIIRECKYTIRNKFGWSANDWAYSLLVQGELEGCAVDEFERRKNNIKRHPRRDTNDSLTRRMSVLSGCSTAPSSPTLSERQLSHANTIGRARSPVGWLSNRSATFHTTLSPPNSSSSTLTHRSVHAMPTHQRQPSDVGRHNP